MQPSIITEGTFTPDDLLISGPVVTESVVVPTGQTILRGTVMGKITSGGKLIKSLSGASDGSQTPYGIAVEAITTSGDVTTLVYTSGVFNSNALDLGASHTLASIKAALRDKGIFFEPANAAR